MRQDTVADMVRAEALRAQELLEKRWVEDMIDNLNPTIVKSGQSHATGMPSLSTPKAEWLNAYWPLAGHGVIDTSAMTREFAVDFGCEEILSDYRPLSRWDYTNVALATTFYVGLVGLVVWWLYR